MIKKIIYIRKILTLIWKFIFILKDNISENKIEIFFFFFFFSVNFVSSFFFIIYQECSNKVCTIYEVITVWQIMVTLSFFSLLLRRLSFSFLCLLLLLRLLLPPLLLLLLPLLSFLSLPLLQWIVVVIWIVVACNNGSSGRNKKEIESSVCCLARTLVYIQWTLVVRSIYIYIYGCMCATHKPARVTRIFFLSLYIK